MTGWKAQNGVMVEVDRATLTIRSFVDPANQMIAVLDEDTMGQLGEALQKGSNVLREQHRPEMYFTEKKDG